MTSQATKGSLLVIFLTVFIDLLGFGMVLPLLPVYADHFNIGNSGWMLGALMASFSAMQFIFAPFWGRLSDRIGRRPVIMIGLAGSVIFYALFGYATQHKSLLLLFIARIGAGIAGATISTAQAYIADSTTPEKRSHGMALIGMAFGLGFTFGPLLGYFAVPDGISDPGPWPGYIAAILSLLALLLAVFYLPESRTITTRPASRRRIIDWGGLRDSLSMPSIGFLFLTIFFCIFSFANFETTISLLVKGDSQERALGSPFRFNWNQICLTFAFIGFTLAMVQGGIVRRLSKTMSEIRLAATGAVLEIGGFTLVTFAVSLNSVPLLFVSLGIVVAGFSFLQPSLNGLLSRRTDPERQGVVLGVGQSVSSLARIMGGYLGIPLLKLNVVTPYYLASALMVLGLLMILTVAKHGADFTQPVEAP